LHIIGAGAGKIVKNIAVAYGAATGIEWLMQVYRSYGLTEEEIRLVEGQV